MRLKLLLFVFLMSGTILTTRAGVAVADQDTIQGLVITEAVISNQADAYFEITNMGTETVNLSVIEWGEIRPWGPPPWEPIPTRHFMLPDFDLAPGASFVIAGAFDFEPKQFAKGLEGYREKVTKDELWDLADMLIHVKESNSIPGEDSIDANGGAEMFGDIAGGRSCFFIRQHINETDSVVLDQVGGVFDGPNGLNLAYPYDVAGFTDATNEAYLIRKYSVKTGNLDFANARGVGEDDSEWITVANETGRSWRAVPWTLGNHGDYNLDENTLRSSVADVDFANLTITVPWGTRRGDGVMKLMEFTPGLAWNYNVSPVHKDSLSFAAHTGDQLDLTVCGNDADRALFDIIVADPTPDANIVVPMSNEDPVGNWRDDNEYGMLTWPRVTTHESGIDTIWGARGGIPYATRVDTLLERLDKPANATWEMVYVDGVEKRADIKEGDILKVTASDGSVKNYYISVLPIRENDDAFLLAITWPDIPEFYYGLFGWTGDTIPSFSPTVYNYRIEVPFDVSGIPALVAKTSDANAKVIVDRAANLTGTVEDRTVTFTVQAEDDTTFRYYHVELVKGKNPVNLQPYFAEPFLSELVFWEQWSNSFGEICNPGNQPLDLSNYMIAMQWNTDPSAVIQSRMDPSEWLDRFDKYVPGYKWVDEATWQVTPGILVQDLNVNPIVMPGDVFTFGGIWQTAWSTVAWNPTWVWPVASELDVQFNNHYGNLTFENPWGEPISGNGSPIRKWMNSNWYMFKILNDSIKQGLKPANDPNDFELIENWGMADGSTWVIGGKTANMLTNWIRKPNIYTANPDFEGSFGTNPDDSEWTYTDDTYWRAQGFGWPYWTTAQSNDIGKHFFNTPTHYKSTVSSVVYKVSEGYSMNELIKGMTTGTTVQGFLDNIIKQNENQTLTVTSGADGSELTGGDAIAMGDWLTVLSADSTNTSKYKLDVTDEGLSADALITSNKYTVEVQAGPKSAGGENEAGTATITGFEYGTALTTIIANITVPAGAMMDVVDGDGAYVPLKRMNFDTTYVNVTVNDNIYFVVVAEDGLTSIVYQLIPDVSEKYAFITSDIYEVVQKDLLIQYVPRGTNVQSFLSNLVASAGASVDLIDKYGMARVDGTVADDDKVVVTSVNGEVTKAYFISMLAEKYIPETTYLAYILSNLYNIDQVGYLVNGVSGSESVSNFYTRIRTAAGATAVVVDKNGNEKTSGDIDGGDMVKVTSADGKIEVTYSFGPLTATDIVETNNIEIYPNPTSGKLNVSGVERGNRIQVFNSTGSAIRDIVVESSIEMISLQKEPAGMYMIIISDNNKLLGRYKAIKQ